MTLAGYVGYQLFFLSFFFQLFFFQPRRLQRAHQSTSIFGRKEVRASCDPVYSANALLPPVVAVWWECIACPPSGAEKRGSVCPAAM